MSSSGVIGRFSSSPRREATDDRSTIAWVDRSDYWTIKVYVTSELKVKLSSGKGADALK
jgi:hypothetical protein